jgi:hypothetical protein
MAAALPGNKAMTDGADLDKKAQCPLRAFLAI